MSGGAAVEFLSLNYQRTVLLLHDYSVLREVQSGGEMNSLPLPAE